MALGVVGESEARAGTWLGAVTARRRARGAGQSVIRGFIAAEWLVRDIAEPGCQVVRTEVEGALTEPGVFDEYEVAVVERVEANRERVQTLPVIHHRSDESATLEPEPGMRASVVQIQTPRLAQLSHELHDRGHPDTVERALQLNHGSDATLMKAEDGLAHRLTKAGSVAAA